MTVSPTGSAPSPSPAPLAEAARHPQRTPGGPGYNPYFLTTEVALPTLTGGLAADGLQVEGSAVVDYTHFSLTMSRSRRLARWVAWNVDGSSLHDLPRSNDFRVDPRLPADSQVGEEVYADNRLDRGHIARRADLTWGDADEAAAANSDSFCFTNITPQMDDFNQAMKSGLWGQLEEALYAAASVDRLRVNVFGGPVLQDDDEVYRGVAIPREFWKVFAWEDDGELSARGFLLRQVVKPVSGIDVGELVTYQVPVRTVIERTGVELAPTIRDVDAPPSLLARQLHTVDDIVW